MKLAGSSIKLNFNEESSHSDKPKSPYGQLVSWPNVQTLLSMNSK